ncbi:hypothetical protein INQ45_06575 [Flavobacterium columnare]|uniref:hypothetical protein n=1 Tax=Flavobacterium columnare TaxID=996 RepID=UPI002D20D350|nr:hypothetical protein [Flavobacterium columnare]MEB3800745.1 hypothetical protein [Flavobacterium columnare]
MKRLILILLIGFCLNSFGQEHYEKAYSDLNSMLNGKTELNFSKALFIVENAWYNNKLNYSDFDKQIDSIATLCQKMIDKKGLNNYKTASNWAIFMYMTQKVPENKQNPYSYDFEDFLGEKDFSSTFVTRILKYRKGNCLSLPLLYKSIAQKMNADAKLTLGPSHAWIRHIDEDENWANVELTSGQFPTDGILMTELDIKREAIQTGAYFKPLSEKETIAFLLTQLALGYQAKFDKLDDFTEKCSNLSINHFEPNVIAYSIKINKVSAEAIKKQQLNHDVLELHKQYVAYQKTLNNLGADNIKPEEYNKWINTMKNRKN